MNLVVYTKIINFAVNYIKYKLRYYMKPITNILLVLALVFYVFLPIIEIYHIGSISGRDFTSSLLTNSDGFLDTILALTPFITLFLAIGINCLKSRWWGILDAIIILMAIFFFVNILTKFQGLPLMHVPEIAADTEMPEGIPVGGLKSGFYLSSAFTILAFFSALVSLMPFEFNKRIEERFGSSKKHIGKMGHSIHNEINKIGKKPKENAEQQTASPEAQIEDKPIEEAITTEAKDPNDHSRFMPDEMNEDEKYSDYMPK